MVHSHVNSAQCKYGFTGQNNELAAGALTGWVSDSCGVSNAHPRFYAHRIDIGQDGEGWHGIR